VPPYIGGEWVLPDPAAYGENLVYEKADFRVSLSFADPANAPVVAASAPAALDQGALVYSLPNARNFTISASPEFLVSSADANGITIYNYYFAANADAAAMVLELTRMSVNTYSAEFGPYPHAALSVCETDLNDGLETDGLYFLASNFYRGFDGSVKNNLSIIAVHETAHQWWYGVVANNQAEEPWLDEALSTYSEHVFYEDNYPDLISWWWNFRIYSQEATGWVDTRIYDTSSFRAYVNAVYFNGAHFLQSLRDRIGDRAFFAFLRDYYARNNGRIASAYDFFAILDLHTSVDISDLVQQFFQYR
jgi:aminopeptidase N